eukprot:m.455779 g.455779  ORF g.455779 m.455779 type:complete len:1326 (+) comp20937_c0_seq1:194-4171(+)
MLSRVIVRYSSRTAHTKAPQIGQIRDRAELEANAMRLLLSSKGGDVSLVFGHILRNLKNQSLQATFSQKLGLVRRLWQAAHVASRKNKLALNDVHYAAYLDVHTIHRDFGMNLSVLETRMENDGIRRTPTMLSSLATGYGHQGNVSKVFELNEECTRSGGHLDNFSMAVVDGYLRQRSYAEAVDFAIQHAQPNKTNRKGPLLHMRMLQEFGREGVSDQAVRVIDDLKARPNLELSGSNWNHLISAFIVHGDLDRAVATLRLRPAQWGHGSRTSQISIEAESTFMRACIAGDRDEIENAASQYDSLNLRNCSAHNIETRPMVNTVLALVHALRVTGATDRLLLMLDTLESVGAESYVHNHGIVAASCQALAQHGEIDDAMNVLKRAVRRNDIGLDAEALGCFVFDAVVAAMAQGSDHHTIHASACDDIVDIVDTAAASEAVSLNAHGWSVIKEHFLRSQRFDDAKVAAFTSTSTSSEQSEFERLCHALEHNVHGSGAFTSSRLIASQLSALARDARAGTPNGNELTRILKDTKPSSPPEVSIAAVDCLLAHGFLDEAEEFVDMKDVAKSVIVAQLVKYHANSGNFEIGLSLLETLVDAKVWVPRHLALPLFEACASSDNVRGAVKLLGVVKAAHIVLSTKMVELLFLTCCNVEDSDAAQAILRLAVSPQCETIGRNGFLKILATMHRTVDSVDLLQKSLETLYATGVCSPETLHASHVAAEIKNMSNLAVEAAQETYVPRHSLSDFDRRPQTKKRKSDVPLYIAEDDAFAGECDRLVAVLEGHVGDLSSTIRHTVANVSSSLLQTCEELTSVLGAPLPNDVGHVVIAAHLAGKGPGQQSIVLEDLDIFHKGLVTISTEAMLQLLPGLRSGEKRTHDAKTITADDLVTLWYESHGYEHELAHRDVSMEIFRYYNNGVQDIRRAREVYDKLMSRSDLSKKHAHQIVIDHLTLSIYRRHDLAVAEMLDAADRFGLISDDFVVVDVIRRLQQQGRKSFDQFTEMLLKQIQNPTGEKMPYTHKVNLLRVYSAFVKSYRDTSSNQALTTAENTFNQIEQDGQTAGIWAQIFWMQALLASGSRSQIQQAEDLHTHLLSSGQELSSEAHGSCASGFVRGYADLLQRCPDDERPLVIQNLLRHVESLLKSGTSPTRQTTSMLIRGLASVPETEAACFVLYENIPTQGDAGAALKEYVKMTLERHGSRPTSSQFDGLYNMMQLRSDVDCDNVLFILRHFVDTQDSEKFQRFFGLRTRMAKNNRNLHLHLAEAHMLHLRSIVGDTSGQRRQPNKASAQEILDAVDLMRDECGSIPHTMRAAVQEIADQAQSEIAQIL